MKKTMALLAATTVATVFFGLGWDAAGTAVCVLVIGPLMVS